MSSVPNVDPELVVAAFDRWLAACSGKQPLDKEALEVARAVVDRVSGGRATEMQIKFAAVAFSLSKSERMFGALVARVEAFIALTQDAERQAVWATRGWIKLSNEAAGAIAPARFLLTVAATCPLDVGADSFPVHEFEQRAQRVARALHRPGAA